MERSVRREGMSARTPGWWKRPFAAFVLLTLFVAPAGVQAQGRNVMTFTIHSTAFPHEGDIPSHYTCDGKDVSPPLSWSDIPRGTKSLALIVDDPDAPDPRAPKMVWVHWVVYDIPPTATGLAEGANPLPEGIRDGTNDWNRAGYGGPCPPIGTHRYFFKLYALDTLLPNLHRPSKQALLRAMEGHILGEATLMGRYKKGG